ncbi:hypothetical protein CYMTET_10657 [Cymbomonas tetramitiformis]|uniref:Rhodanese domain-containing protein n=1 Tax=Cymbomonas tetramitiformis TaxID=36881 RepID=A0AAE0LDT2_9CHLO|nr:hypothetical protein CYMTET_10657 [Cymbomonas tetramitiformis]
MAQSLANTIVAKNVGRNAALPQGRKACSVVSSLSSKVSVSRCLKSAPKTHASRVSHIITSVYPAKPQGPIPRPSGGFSGWKPGQYPDPALVEATLANFPEKGIGSVEECMALYLDADYKILDVRSPMEVEDEGKVGGSYNIPLLLCQKKYNPEIEKKEVVQTPNPDFIATVKETFPDTATNIIVMCSNGRQRAMQTLVALDEAGYTNLVGMKGGYNYFYYVFDNKFRRRDIGRAKTVWSADGSTGIFASGVDFLMSDGGDEGYVAKDEVDYIDWATTLAASGSATPAAAAPEPAPASFAATPTPEPTPSYAAPPAAEPVPATSAPANPFAEFLSASPEPTPSYEAPSTPAAAPGNQFAEFLTEKPGEGGSFW